MNKEYSNDYLTVVWKPDLCIHAGECVKRLPNVYRPKEKPWIKIENANNEALIRQINTCPSGALTYYLNENKMEESKEKSQVKATVFENGPLIINGTFELKGIDGKVELREKSTAFCRCGGSSNKPYCDGAHKKNDFAG
jgi:uncharacterized Fe-S cluster protein YjdI